jgi:hypothetical protein
MLDLAVYGFTSKHLIVFLLALRKSRRRGDLIPWKSEGHDGYLIEKIVAGSELAMRRPLTVRTDSEERK